MDAWVKSRLVSLCLRERGQRKEVKIKIKTAWRNERELGVRAKKAKTSRTVS
mgnify:CR=1 FL=1